MKNSYILLIILTLFISNECLAQSFGDSYELALSKCNNYEIFSKIPNQGFSFKIKNNGIEIISNLTFIKGRLAFMGQMIYLNENEGKLFYNGIYDNYYKRFGNPKKDKITTIEENGGTKIQSAWEETSEALVLTIFILKGESLVTINNFDKLKGKR